MRRYRDQISIGSQLGFSIIEVLVTLGIAAFLGLVMSSLITSQVREFKSLNQKADAAEARLNLILSFSKMEVCGWHLKNKVIDVSDVTSTKASSSVINLDTLYAGPDANSLVIASVGKELSATSRDLVVDNIQFGEILSTGMPNEYRGNLKVNFRAESLIRALKPVSVQLTFRTKFDDPTTGQRILDCSYGSSIKAFAVNINDLLQYHSGVKANCVNMNTEKMYWDSACSRYCSTGCTGTGAPVSCSGSFPGHGYVSGVANECNGTSNTAQCVCFK